VPIGAGLSDCQAIICEADAELDVSGLLAGCGLSSWQFDHLVGSQRAVVAPDAAEIAAPFIDVSEGYAAYLADGGHRVRNFGQKDRKLGREIGPVRFGFDVHDDAALEQLLAWKSAQYRRTGRPDRFAVKSNVQLIHDLAALSDPVAHADLSGTLMTLHAGDRLVAVEFSLRSGPVLAGWFPAYHVEYSRYSPSSIRTLRMIEAMSAAGVRRYDFGKGDEEYKNWLKTGDSHVCEGWVVRPVLSGYVRRAAARPREMLFNTVLRHHRLRLAARAALRRLGAARVVLSRRSKGRSQPH